MRKFIIDCDPGMDDLIALGYLIKNDFNIIGVSTVSGNVDCDNSTLNTLKFLSVLNSDVKVYKGASEPLVQEKIHALDIHGEDGSHGILSDVINKKEVEKEKASEFLVRSILENKNEIEIIALGPLTNIATLLLNNYECRKYIKHIYIMGGSHAFGNITPSAEFNFYADPEAAKYVFESGVPISMIGLDATLSEGLTGSDIDDLEKTSKNTEWSKLIIKLLRKSLSISKKFGLEKAYIHDLITAIVPFNDNFVEFKKYNVSIETKGVFTRGKSVVDIDGVSKREVNTNVGFSFNKVIYLDIIKNLLNREE